MGHAAQGVHVAGAGAVGAGDAVEGDGDRVGGEGGGHASRHTGERRRDHGPGRDTRGSACATQRRPPSPLASTAWVLPRTRGPRSASHGRGGSWLSRWPWRSLAYLRDRRSSWGSRCSSCVLCVARQSSASSSAGGWGWSRSARRIRPHPARAPAGPPPAPGVVAGGRLRVPARGRALAAGLPAAAVPRSRCPVVMLLAPAPRPRPTTWRSSAGTSTPAPRPGWRRWSGWALAVVAAYVVTLAAVAQAALARLLLDPREAELAATVADLRRSRVDLVDAFETERRRIERDLHDGVQQRLVALTMTLGRAELDVAGGAGAGRRAGRAPAGRGGAGRPARHHPRHPPAGAGRPRPDRGRARAGRPVLGAGHGGHPARPSGCRRPVEQAAYFVVSEALTNVARHAGARRAGVHAWRARATRSC